MNRYIPAFCFVVLTLAAGNGCGSKPPANQAKSAAAAPDRIQGKAQVLIESAGGAMDSTLNAGSASSVYIWEGVHRYRLFFRTPQEVTHGDEYVVEGVNAQRVIDEIGDPDQGKNGYPLLPSCRRVITTAWKNLPLDAIDLDAQALRIKVNRYPARTVFLVTRIQPVKATEGGAAAKKGGAAEEKDVPEVSVPGAKQRAFLVGTPPVQTAPLWEPKAETVSCQVVIGPDGKIAELETGKQLCEFVDWSKYLYQPPVKAGHPVKVSTEVEVRFEALKQAKS